MIVFNFQGLFTPNGLTYLILYISMFTMEKGTNKFH